MRLLLGRLLGIDNGAGRLLSAEHLQNLLRGLGAGVGLVRVRLLLFLARGISAVHFGLSRGLGLIVRVLVGVIGVVGVFIVFGAIVDFGIRRLYIRRLRDDELLVERLRLGKTGWRHCSRKVLMQVRGTLGLSGRRRLWGTGHARHHGGIGTGPEDYVVKRGAVEQGRQNVAWRSRPEVSDYALCA